MKLVGAWAADERVVSIATPERVIAGVADESVGGRIALEIVVPGPANHGFDVGHDVVARRGAGGVGDERIESDRAVVGMVVERDAHGGGSRGIVSGVAAAAARDDFRTVATDERVVAAVAEEARDLRSAVAELESDLVIAARAVDRGAVGDDIDDVAFGVAVAKQVGGVGARV